MNLSDIYQNGGLDALKALAEKTGSNVQYLRQCATNWNDKRPSPELAAKLIAADSRITWDDLYSEQIKAADTAA